MSAKTSVFDARFYVWLFVAGFLTFVLHEAAHWGAGQVLGYPMNVRLNGVDFLTPASASDQAIADAAGPLITILQAIIGFFLVQRRRSVLAFAFLYFAAFMRLLAAGVSVFHPNDEARLSSYFGLGMWTLPIVVAAGLLFLVWRASRRLGIGWKEHLLCYLVASLSISAVVAIDRLML
jgi:hypothetical protein